MEQVSSKDNNRTDVLHNMENIYLFISTGQKYRHIWREKNPNRFTEKSDNCINETGEINAYLRKCGLSVIFGLP